MWFSTGDMQESLCSDRRRVGARGRFPNSNIELHLPQLQACNSEFILSCGVSNRGNQITQCHQQSVTIGEKYILSYNRQLLYIKLSNATDFCILTKDEMSLFPHLYASGICPIECENPQQAFDVDSLAKTFVIFAT